MIERLNKLDKSIEFMKTQLRRIIPVDAVQVEYTLFVCDNGYRIIFLKKPMKQIT